MDPTISVSKGVFVFKNGGSFKNKTKTPSKQVSSILSGDIIREPFYRVFSQTWGAFKDDIEHLQKASCTQILEDLVEYIRDVEKLGNILPAAALLTGINQPDHEDQFNTLSQRIKETVKSSVAIINSRDATHLKNAVEALVYEVIENNDEERETKRLRKTQMNMDMLEAWYDKDECDCLVVILPDFESFNPEVLQDFILILSSYSRRIPIVLVLGVATAVSAVHGALPYHVTSKIKLRIFQTQSAPLGLNEILEKVLLSTKHSFFLSGKTFNFLTQVFFFYDFSISGFIQSFRYCLMEHFMQGNAISLCTNYEQSLKFVDKLSHSDIEFIRRLPSFRPYVESLKDFQKIIDILTEDSCMKAHLPALLKECHLYSKVFRCFVEFLTVLVEDLPRCPLGKYRREIYTICMSKEIIESEEFKECWQILSFMSKDEFSNKIFKAMSLTLTFVEDNFEEEDSRIAREATTIMQKALEEIRENLQLVIDAGTNVNEVNKENTASGDLTQLSRQELKDKLLQMAKEDKQVSEFSKAVETNLEFLKTEIIGKFLRPLSKAPPLHEIFVFSDIAMVKKNIVGAPRAALHMALNNPQFYLQCKCCDLETGSLVPTLPDLSVVYKLHLECGKMINMFDWLQAFRSVVDTSQIEDEEDRQIDPSIQARFTRAVAELQFLGYIKTSKRKTDHVTRLTW
ncbi:ORC3 family protein [Megaselia abdita]